MKWKFCRSFVIQNTFIDFVGTHRFRILTINDPSDQIENYIEQGPAGQRCVHEAHEAHLAH